MKKILLFTFVLVVFMMPQGQAQTQNLELQTYFPAPYGAYDRLRLVPQDSSVIDIGGNCAIGSLGVKLPDELLFCADVAGNGQWQRVQGVWTQNENNIFPTATYSVPALQVGIGLTTPAADVKLHISGGTNAAKMRIDSSSAQIVGLDLYQGSTRRGKMELDTSGNLAIENPDNGNKNLLIRAGTNPYIKLRGDNNNVGLNTDSPTAMLDVVKPGTSAAPYFRVGTNGDKFEIGNGSNDGRVYINTTQRPAARLYMYDPIGSVGFLRTNGSYYDDLYYSGGSDNITRFVHAGSSSSGRLDFVSTASGSPVNLARLNNSGQLYVNRKVAIGRMGMTNSDKVEFHVHEQDPSEEVVGLMSDAGTNTNVSDGSFPYISTDTVGAFMPQKDLTGSDTHTGHGGFLIAGFSRGSDSSADSGLTLMGVLGTGAPGATPAIEVEGVKVLSNALTRMGGSDIVLGINYASDPDDDDAGTVFLANGNVGIGFDPADPLPTAKLHVRGAVRIQPRNNPPGACDATVEGSLYSDDNAASLCFCNGSTWTAVAGVGPCQ